MEMPPPRWLILAFLLLPLLCWSPSRALYEDGWHKTSFFVDTSSSDSTDEDIIEAIIIESSEEEGHFSYFNSVRWSDRNPTCGGRRQSPINIEIDEVETGKQQEMPLRGLSYEIKPQKMRLNNNGHTVVVTGVWSPQMIPIIWGGPLKGIYQFHQMHFHWAATNRYGSEHTIGNQSYPLEVHFVHYKKAYQNWTNALTFDDGVVVIAYFYSIDREPNHGIEILQEKFPEVEFPTQYSVIRPIPLQFFGINLMQAEYISYRGSLTTPPCAQAVIWIISVNVLGVSTGQMEQFRKIILDENDDHNNRETQLLNGRKVLYFYEEV